MRDILSTSTISKNKYITFNVIFKLSIFFLNSPTKFLDDCVTKNSACMINMQNTDVDLDSTYSENEQHINNRTTNGDKSTITVASVVDHVVVDDIEEDDDEHIEQAADNEKDDFQEPKHRPKRTKAINGRHTPTSQQGLGKSTH